MIALGALAAACGGGSPARAPGPVVPVASARSVAELEGETIVSVDIEGQRSVEVGPLRAGLGSRTGDPFDREKVAADIRRLWSAAAFEDVTADVRRAAGGVALTFAVVERPLIGAARIEGDPPPATGAGRVAGLAGGLYEPARLRRIAERLRRSYRRAGHLRARVELRVHPSGRRRVDVAFRATAGPRYLVDAIDFTGHRRIDAARLRAEVRTRGGAVNASGALYRDDLLAEDLARIPSLYNDLGMIEASVGAPRLVFDERRRRLRVVVPVDEGAVYRLGRVSLTGLLAKDSRRYHAALGVRSGETFSAARLAAGMERAQTLASELHRAPVVIRPETAVDLDRRTIDVTLSVDGEPR